MTWLTHFIKFMNIVQNYYSRVDMTEHSGNEVGKIYQEIGLKRGDVVFVHANMLSFGLVSRDKDKFVKFFLDPLLKVIGKSGTIACHSYTFSYGLHGTRYIHEKSPSEAGMFTEYIRTMKGAMRSFHPLASISAYGPKAPYITGNVTRSSSGLGSPFARLHALKAKCLYIGMTCGESCSFLHHVEQMYGVSHCYNKAFFHPAYRRGKLQPGPYLAFLRNRKSEPYDFSSFQREMKKKKLVHERVFRNAPIQCIDLDDCFNVGMEMLDRDPCAFLRKSFYVTK